MKISGKIIMLAIPKNQFDEEELFETRAVLESAGARTIVLSKTGQEAGGMKKTRFKPDGMIVDWNKQAGVAAKYDAVLVIGGKGSEKFLWDDPILPQILTDHYRAGKIVGASGLSVAVLARAALLGGEASGPDYAPFLKELAGSGTVRTDRAVTCCGKVVSASGGEASREFAETIVDLLAADG
ncbi:MAG: DJ-1/PfpI family protein [Nitrospinae bacterium]|nr:DJ-1/PfpI family protein [Nitrospinota bacterium]